jgi:hypothetical protein
MKETTGRANKRGVMKSLPVRRSPAERDVIKKLAKDAGLSEARLLVMAALLLAEFKTQRELRAVVHVGGLLWQSRTQAVMHVRRLGHQLESLREGLDPGSDTASLSRLDEVLAEVATVLKSLK